MKVPFPSSILFVVSMPTRQSQKTQKPFGEGKKTEEQQN